MRLSYIANSSRFLRKSTATELFWWYIRSKGPFGKPRVLLLPIADVISAAKAVERIVNQCINWGEFMRLSQYIPEIERKVSELAFDYSNTTGLILTEDDLKFHLVRKLYEIDGLANPSETIDPGIFATPIHTELSWYGPTGQLGVKPDISIIEPQHLSILHNLDADEDMPNKQCHFAGHSIIFELKFVKIRSGITHGKLLEIEEDVEQVRGIIENLNEPYRDDVFGFIVVFNKTGRAVPEFHQLLENYRMEEKIRILYHTADVTVPRRTRRR